MEKLRKVWTPMSWMKIFLIKQILHMFWQACSIIVRLYNFLQQETRLEEKINLEDVDNFLDGYELPELHKEALINLEDDDFYLESKKQCLIPQVDGLDDISLVKKRFSVNCESEKNL